MEILEKIYPSPKSVKLLGGSVKLSGVRNETGDGSVLDSFLHSAEELCLSASEGGNIFLVINREIESDEGYSILAKDGGVRISAKSRQGFVYAAGTLSQLADNGEIPCIELYDEPLCKIRGVHMYLPPSDAIDEFLRVLDLLARLKYNTVFLEIGGGVEYESHPEINVAWKRFCREARDYYGGPQGLQASEAHWKDSTHVELAGGHCLKKSELKKIVDYIRFLGMEVIPEIQALSHAYYLTLSHPEIAEQTFEPYPDTWCPMNEASYRLYEDIARELHELLGFTKVSIGHDEIRILGKCPHCREKSGAELPEKEISAESRPRRSPRKPLSQAITDFYMNLVPYDKFVMVGLAFVLLLGLRCGAGIGGGLRAGAGIGSGFRGGAGLCRGRGRSCLCTGLWPSGNPPRGYRLRGWQCCW